MLQNNDVRTSLLNPTTRLDFIGGPSGRKFYRADKNNFAPNLGFAWDPFGTGRTSVRGGYMISFPNDNLIATVQTTLGANAGLRSFTTLPNQTATLADRPIIPTPPYKVPRTFADNYALSPRSSAGIAMPGLVTPYVQQWNVSVEREVAGVLISARYIGNKGSDLLRMVDYNQVIYDADGFLADFKRAQANGAAAEAATGHYNPSFNADIPGSQPLTVFPRLAAGGQLTNFNVINLIRTGQVGELASTYQISGGNGDVNFFPNPDLVNAVVATNGGSSHYNGLQLEATRRVRDGLQMQFSYTYGKSMANNRGTSAANLEPLLDNANPQVEYARTPFDIRHAFKANYYYELPYGPGKPWSGNRVLNHLLGNWALSGIWTYTSGSPFSILSGYGTVNTQQISFLTNTASIEGTTLSNLKPLTSGVYRTGDKLYFVSPALLNTDGRATSQAGAPDFAGQAFYNPGAGQLGNLPRRAFSGPWNFGWDMSAIKTLQFGERHRLELHFDFFNVFNHPTFNLGVSNINQPTFGQLTSMRTIPRQIQIGAYYRF